MVYTLVFCYCTQYNRGEIIFIIVNFMLWVHFYMLLNWFRNLYSQYKGQLSAVWALPVLNQLYIKYFLYFFYISPSLRVLQYPFCLWYSSTNDEKRVFVK